MAKLESPAAERNKEPIWQVLHSKVVPSLVGKEVRILEIATGAGVHTHHFAKQLLQLGVCTFRWYPSDTDERYIASTQAYVKEEPDLSKVVEPVMKLTLNEDGIIEQETRNLLDEVDYFDLILNINMIHITRWEATLGLMQLASSKLRSGGTLLLYGPFKVDGKCVESNR